MLISRIFISIALKYKNQSVLNTSRCFLSSSASSEKKTTQERNSLINQSDSISSKKSTDDNNNEWLWAYLRDRLSFADLTEEQKRRVIEIGKIIDVRSFVY